MDGVLLHGLLATSRSFNAAHYHFEGGNEELKRGKRGITGPLSCVWPPEHGGDLLLGQLPSDPSRRGLPLSPFVRWRGLAAPLDSEALKPRTVGPRVPLDPLIWTSSD